MKTPKPSAKSASSSLPAIARPSRDVRPVTIRPVGDRILIRHQEEKEQLRGGIIIPDSAKEKPQEATVIALGTGHTAKDGQLTPFEVKVGDRVLVAKFGGAEVKLNDQKYTLVREDDLLGILT